MGLTLGFLKVKANLRINHSFGKMDYRQKSILYSEKRLKVTSYFTKFLNSFSLNSKQVLYLPNINSISKNIRLLKTRYDHLCY
ncbi:MAG: hypothetical protein C0397_04650 [Odoribacter sp.]|nr:hypothetical protein [Odoribacter sp.]